MRQAYVSPRAAPSTLRSALSVSGSHDETAAGAEILAIGAGADDDGATTGTLRPPMHGAPHG